MSVNTLILIQAVTSSSPCGRGREATGRTILKGIPCTQPTAFVLASLTVHRITFAPTTFIDADLLGSPITNSWLTPDANAKPSIWRAASPPRMPYTATPFPASAPAANRSGRTGFQVASPTAARRRWRLWFTILMPL